MFYLYFHVIAWSVSLYHIEVSKGEHIETVLFCPPQDLEAIASIKKDIIKYIKKQ